MKRNFLMILALAALCLVLVSCKKKESGTQINQPNAPAATATPVPTPTLPPYEANALTGEPKDADYPEGQRITAVMVNNIVRCRPQRGLSKAQILFEIKVEGGITRFMAVFNDYNDIDEIGPVRSGRDQFFQLILPWQALYVHEGQSTMMEYYARDFQYGTLNNNNGAYGYRNYSRVNWMGESYNNGTLPLEHTMYTSGENIGKYIADSNVDMNRTYNSTFFNFVDYRVENSARDLTNSIDSAYTSEKYGPVVKDGEYIEITHSQSYKTRFLYDAATGQYKMQQNYSDGKWRDTVDEGTGTVLSFPNVFVLYTDIHTYPQFQEKDIQEVVYGNGGIGYYCYGGKCEKIYWQKGTPMAALQLYYLTPDGQCSDVPLDVNIGKSYVTVADIDFAGDFVASAVDGVDTAAAGTKTYETNYVDDDAEEPTSAGTTSAPEVTPEPAPTPAPEQDTQPAPEQSIPTVLITPSPEA